jgi:hypothetical protein
VGEEDLAGGALADLGLHHVLADARGQGQCVGRGSGRGGRRQGVGGEGETGRHSRAIVPGRAWADAPNKPV